MTQERHAVSMSVSKYSGFYFYDVPYNEASQLLHRVVILLKGFVALAASVTQTYCYMSALGSSGNHSDKSLYHTKP